VKTRRARELKKCEDRLAEIEGVIAELNDAIRQRSDELAAVTKQEHEGGATYARYTDNLRLRRLRTKLAQLQSELSGYDMEEAARAKRNFDKKYPKMQKRLEELKDRVRGGLRGDYLLLIFPFMQRARLGGELSTQKAHLENMEADLATDFHDINKRYTAQLVQVKVCPIGARPNSYY
jgi:DNA repair protein RAD50